MIQLTGGNITKDSTVVLTPVRTPLEFLGSLLKVWCPCRGLGNYASGIAMLDDLMIYSPTGPLSNGTTTAGSNNITLSAAVGITGTRVTINAISRFVASGSGVNYVFSSIWMNEGTYPTTGTYAVFVNIISQLNDKSGNSNHLTQPIAINRPLIILNSKKVYSANGSNNVTLNMPLNLLNNASKFLFGIKVVNFAVTGTSSYIIRITNNAATRDRFSVAVQLVSSKIRVTIAWDNGGTQYTIELDVQNTTLFTICTFFDFSANRLFLRCNEVSNFYFAPSTSAIDNNDASYSRLQGGGANNSVLGAYFQDPVLAVGSGLGVAHLEELFDYYKYI